MTAKELQNLSIEELQAKLAEEKVNYDKLKLTHNVSPIANPVEITKLRKQIARISTVLTAKKAI